MDIILIIITITVGILLLVGLIARLTSKRTVNEIIQDKVILKIAVPRHNEKSPVAAEQLFSSLHGMLAGKKKSIDHFSLEIAAGNYGIHFIITIDRRYKGFIENQFYGQYPEAQISEIGDYSKQFDSNSSYAFKELGLVKDSYLPIKTFESFEVDPLAAITSAISSLNARSEAFIQIVVRPVSDSWHEAGKSYVNTARSKTDPDGNKIGLESGEAEIVSRIERKNTKVGFQFKIRVLAKSNDALEAERINKEIVASFGQYKTGQFNSVGNKPRLTGIALHRKKLRNVV